jgi:hypothetical protein
LKRFKPHAHKVGPLRASSGHRGRLRGRANSAGRTCGLRQGTVQDYFRRDLRECLRRMVGSFCSNGRAIPIPDSATLDFFWNNCQS